MVNNRIDEAGTFQIKYVRKELLFGRNREKDFKMKYRILVGKMLSHSFIRKAQTL